MYCVYLHILHETTVFDEVVFKNIKALHLCYFIGLIGLIIVFK